MSQSVSDSPQTFSNGPDASFEKRFSPQIVCGVDEAGRGPLAGSVVAAAVILDLDHIPDGLNDSKKLTERKRNILFEQILENAQVSIASVSAATIDEINIREASLQAMTLAVRGLETIPGHALVDGNAIPKNLPCQATDLVKGDSRSVSIAAASIIAKVTRDRMILKAAELYPQYGFASHKGYGTKVHMQALEEYGPCPLHRMTFAPVKNAIR